MLLRASRTSPRDANPAVMQERTQASPRENTSQLHAQTVVRKQKFPSSPQATDPYTAAIALQQ